MHDSAAVTAHLDDGPTCVTANKQAAITQQGVLPRMLLLLAAVPCCRAWLRLQLSGGCKPYRTVDGSMSLERRA
jgi:hypothetical protein